MNPFKIARKIWLPRTKTMEKCKVFYKENYEIEEFEGL